MASKVQDAANNMFSTIGAIQTLVENFPMNLISFGDFKFSTSFDVLAILLKMLGTSNEEIVEIVTNALTGGMDDESGSWIAYAEEVVKTAIEANIMNVLNCSTNPIISNKLLDSYYTGDKIERGGEGITLDVSEIDFTGVLNRNPFYENDSKFYFDVEEYNASDIWKSKDFNAFLWYIINKSDKTQDEERVWDNRYTDQKLWKGGNKNKKEIIRCTYIDEEYPLNDKIKVHICGARNNEPANYFKTRRLSKKNGEWALNKTIFEFNHDYLMSVKLYDAKVIVAEIVEYLLGTGNFSVNMGFSLNEEIIQGKIQEIIKKAVVMDDMQVSDCYFSFSNEEYNRMLKNSELNRYNMRTNGNGYFETNPTSILDQLGNINSESTLHEDKATISKTLQDITATPAQDPSSTFTFGVSYDWQVELLRMLVYPFVRPLFTPKVIFLLMLNKKIMGSFDDIDTSTFVEDLLNGMHAIILDIVIKLKNMLIDMLMSYILDKLAPLLALFASKLVLEALKMYKDLLFEIFNGCRLTIWNPFGWQPLESTLDNVNYADIELKENEQTTPDQITC
jgi:hypothetical protein